MPQKNLTIFWDLLLTSRTSLGIVSRKINLQKQALKAQSLNSSKEPAEVALNLNTTWSSVTWLSLISSIRQILKETEFHKICCCKPYLVGALGDNNKSGNLEENKYTASFTKAKAARSRQARISNHTVYSRMKILSIVRISVDKQCGHGYLKEIDMFLLYYQNKLHHFDGNVQTDLAVALWFFIRRIVLKHIVEDVQLGVGSYQTKLNLTRPQVSVPEDEVYKFGDATIMKVRDEQKYRLDNFRIGYNEDMPTRPWSDKDRRRTYSMLKVIEKTLHRR
ncbi:hypothetical protein Tco_0978532 [Tanacetum coccineum]|uniref:Uncharacterized protein n=1 Tax=Tanacetum coccineum TaxID=301880 RepID=A0ABQ5ENC8_9ASTR